MDLLSWDRDRPRFPPELFANIIDHQDQEDLANSSLVCTSWLYFARPRLFSCLRFDERRIRMFIHDPNIIDSPLSTIRPVVKEVVIYNSLPLERAEIRQLLSSLKTVTGLSYCPYCIYPILGQKKLDILAETFHNITALTIVGDFRNFQQLTTFICAFPFITSLDVKAEIGFELATSSYLECRPSPSLRVLRLECNLEGIIPWLLQLDPIPQISELTLKGLIGWGSSHIGRLLRALGPSLKHLTLVEKINVYFASCHGKKKHLPWKFPFIMILSRYPVNGSWPAIQFRIGVPPIFMSETKPFIRINSTRREDDTFSSNITFSTRDFDFSESYAF